MGSVARMGWLATQYLHLKDQSQPRPSRRIGPSDRTSPLARYLPRGVNQLNSAANRAPVHNRFAFVGGNSGTWRTLRTKSVCGDGLEPTSHVDIVSPTPDSPSVANAAKWVVTGVMSSLRYATRPEVTDLRKRQDSLGRPQATRAALIPIKKSAAWWALAQDERREIFAETSHHTAVGLEYLPAVARQLYHCRDLGEAFDFITWFEYARANCEIVATCASKQ